MGTSPISYANSGVDTAEGDRFVDAILPMVTPTQGPEVLAGVGGFAALFALDWKKYREPVLVSGTDGVGTKVLLAHALDVIDTVGIDLVAMCVNDILTTGAKPLFFLDYLATGKLDVARGTKLVKGIVDGCKDAGCALIGGETAEMPGVYKGKEFDLAGFSVGIVEKSRLIQGKTLSKGSVVIALPSSGIHSNGYSLVRRVFLGTSESLPDEKVRELLAERPSSLNGRSLGEALLTPTRIYVRPILSLLENISVGALSHITGGGLPGNAPRVVPKSLAVRIDRKKLQIPAIFHLLQERGKLSDETMNEACNLGAGFLVMVDEKDADTALSTLRGMGESPFVVGELVSREQPERDFEWA